MLLSFYLITLLLIVLFTLSAWIGKKREGVVRGATLAVLQHVTCLILWLGGPAFGLYAAVILVLGLYEIARRYDGIVRRPLNAVILVAASAIVFLEAERLGLYAVPLYLVTAAFAFWGPTQHVRKAIFGAAFGIIVLALGAGYLAVMPANGLAMILTYLLLLQLNDAFGLIVGKAFGRTKLFPRISPNKSVQGYIGGALGVLAGIALLNGWIPALTGAALWKQLAIFGYILLFGNFGDLLFSAVKRKLQLKDFGRLLPGHGGILDRFDNILFAAPLFVLLWEGLF